MKFSLLSSFSRLQEADVLLGVEMASTGEVACFAESRSQAFLKAQLSAGFKLPFNSRNVLLSIGSYKHKNEMLPCVQALEKMGFTLFGSHGTADFYSEHGVKIQDLTWINEDLEVLPISDSPSSDGDATLPSIAGYMADKKFDLVINTPIQTAGCFVILLYLEIAL